MTDLKPGWLREGLRDVAENATDEDRRRVAEHPSGFLPARDPAPPLTEAELTALEELDRACQPATTTNLMTRLVAQSRRALALESELARLRREFDALRALEAHVLAGRCLHSSPTPGPTCETCELLKAVDEARE